MGMGRFEAFVTRYQGPWQRVCLLLGGLYFALLLVNVAVINPGIPAQIQEETSALAFYKMPWELRSLDRSIAFDCGRAQPTALACLARRGNQQEMAAAQSATRLAYLKSFGARAVILLAWLWPLWLALFPAFCLRVVLPLGRWIRDGSTQSTTDKAAQ